MNYYFHKSLGYLKKMRFFLSESLTGFFDLTLSFFVKNQSLRVNQKGKKSILVIGKEFNFRATKYAALLNKDGRFEITIACHRLADLNHVLKDGSFKIVRFRNSSQLKSMLHYSNMDVAIAFTSFASYAEIVMRNFPGKKIFDPYDCITIYYGLKPPVNWMRKEIPSESYCISHSDGILARNLEVKYAAKIADVKLPGKNILFSDYCDEENFIIPVKKSLDNNDEISIVYSGGLYGKSAQKAAHGITNFQPLIDSLSKTGIHLHLYPIPNAPTEYYFEFLEESQRNPFLHMHKSVSNNNLGKELSQYFFGILPHFKDPGHPILPEKLKYATSNKFFNFLEAGIPVIVSGELSYVAWIVKRYNIGVVINREDLVNLNKIILSHDYSLMVANVLSTRKKLSISNNKQRLLNFIEKI